MLHIFYVARVSNSAAEILKRSLNDQRNEKFVNINTCEEEADTNHCRLLLKGRRSGKTNVVYEESWCSGCKTSDGTTVQ